MKTQTLKYYKIYNCSKKIKYLGINLINMYRIYAENYRADERNQRWK